MLRFIKKQSSKQNKKVDTKQINRVLRVMRLFAVVQAYHYYTVMQMGRELLKIDNSWEDAENMSDLMNMLLPHKETSPTDFMHDKDEVSNEILDNYDGFKMWLRIAKAMDISEETLTAFCKNVDHLQTAFRLKVFGHIYYPEWLMAFILYLNHKISKEDLQNSFVEYSLFSGKPKPADFAGFRKTILEIEEAISQIADKQTIRNKKKKI